VARYREIETKGFQEDLSRDFSGQQKRIVRKLQEYVYPQLRIQPYFGPNIKKLKNYEPDTWRYRIGDYRFFYEIDEKNRLVIMLAAENRSDAY
jgi:mRNA interferase RelE/StbE